MLIWNKKMNVQDMPQNAEPRRRTQDERSAATIKKISEATIELIAEVGFVNMTTTMVAKRAGTSRGAILHHFKSKSDLVKHATGAMWAQVTAASREMRERDLSSDLDPDALVDAVWTGLMSDTYVSVTIDMMTAARGDEDLSAHVDMWMRRMFASYRKTAKQVFAASGLNEAESETLILLVTSTLRGLRVAQMIEAEADDSRVARAMLADLVRAYLAQIATQRGQS